MENNTFSRSDLNLANILRERIDACATFKRNKKISKELSEAFSDKNRILTVEESEQIEEFAVSRLLGLFLDTKETLLIPDDGLHKFASEFVTGLNGLDIDFAYQDFYAYQFVDKLNDIVRRALSVKELFTKNRPAEKVIKICREAYLCFLNGFHTASVVLIRSIIETVLKEKLNADIGELIVLNDTARQNGLYQGRIWHKIDQIRRDGNKYIHAISKGEIPSEHKNLQLLGIAQEVLQTIL